jgi:hypothetical protein
MKRLLFVIIISIFLFMAVVTQTTAGCVIQWWGNNSGTVSTNETSKTPQAAKELYYRLPYYVSEDESGVTPVFDGNCYGVDYYFITAHFYKLVCTSGSWRAGITSSSPGCVGTCFRASGTWDVICEATLIKLSSFTATPKSDKVIIQWSTATEIDNAGFNLYRSEAENGEYTKINVFLIPAQGYSTQGASYEFTDTNVQNRKPYYYKLEAIDLNGTSTMHGPVSATPRLIYGIGK